jgi:hypothetical protein
MLALANTKITVLRGETTNEYGDQVDTEEPFKRDIPASLIEQTKQLFDLASGTPRTIKLFTCRVNNNTNISLTDRIKDQSTNAIYAIDNISTPTGPTNASDMRLDLSKVN